MSHEESTKVINAFETFKQEFIDMYERTIQQNSGSNSGLLARMQKLEEKIIESQIENRTLHEVQNKEIQDIKGKLTTLTTDTEPLIEGKKTVSSVFKFILWSSPLAIIYGFLKWLKL
jgi:hypothetical protein